MKVLLIGRGGAQRSTVVLMLEARGGIVDAAGTVDEAASFMAVRTYDMLLLDNDDIGAEGYRSLSWLRRRWPEPRLLVMTSELKSDGAAELIKRTSDDFILKPIQTAELEARVRLLMRSNVRPLRSELIVGPVTLDVVTQHVRISGESVHLTARERGVLNVLLQHSGSVVSKELIASHIFSIDDETAIDVIEVYVHRLRRKLAHPACAIRTVRGLGYIFEVRKV